MKTVTKKVTCEYCNGDGYTFSASYYDGDYYTDDTYQGCHVCGKGGYSSEKLNKINKGTGKLKITYEVIPNGCNACNGEGKIRYFKKGVTMQHTPFGGFNSIDEENKWNQKNTYVEKCQECNGTGEGLREISSEPVSSGWF